MRYTIYNTKKQYFIILFELTVWKTKEGTLIFIDWILFDKWIICNKRIRVSAKSNKKKRGKK